MAPPVPGAFQKPEFWHLERIDFKLQTQGSEEAEELRPGHKCISPGSREGSRAPARARSRRAPRAVSAAAVSMTATPWPGTPVAAAAAASAAPPRAPVLGPRVPLAPAPAERDRMDSSVRMAVTLEGAPWLGWMWVKALMRFAFMVANNLVAIPSYICYVIILQPLRVLDSKRFWHIEGIMYKWLLGMVASWGWYAGYTVMEWGEDIKAISEDEAVMLVNHQATGDVCTLMMCLQDKGLVVAQMMWLMDHIFKYTNFGIVSLIHGDFFIRQGKSHRDQQLLLLRKHLEHNYRNRDRKWIVLFPEGGFLRKRRETSQAFAKKNNLPFLTHVTLPRFGATQIILSALVARQENGSPAGGDAKQLESKSKGLQWIIDTTIAYPKAEPIDIQTWILGYRKPTVTHVHYRNL
ncbi:acyl-CoA:lysophosphatidylglycerol acyltransferase 1 isoform X2 [Perognathus longimembris pacificus]|uniref:acyl-CoA:lysophosphatidylglycerol acyltransferase 1 isoform X2 n=1 Tax=Perognathus longimembris pacificus TaxID=214514 RepID=UPI002018A838|nr:acyl-CoA:lysophosphatidylglycerol acyltransferase 1 isoform X2 [Perognathus longimembris pacificus]